MFRTLLLSAAASAILIGGAAAEGGDRPDTANPLTSYSLVGPLYPQVAMAEPILPLGPVAPMGVTVPRGSAILMNAGTYAVFDGHTYQIEPQSRTVLRVVE